MPTPQTNQPYANGRAGHPATPINRKSEPIQHREEATSNQPKPTQQTVQSAPPAPESGESLYPPGTVLTAQGIPDRRIKGQENMLPRQRAGGIRARGGITDSKGRHFTAEGKADRRYRENVNLTEKEAEIEGAKMILEKAGQLPKKR